MLFTFFSFSIPPLSALLSFLRVVAAAMFEDSFKNLVAAKSLGLSTVFVQSDTAREEGVSDEQLEKVDAVVKDVSHCMAIDTAGAHLIFGGFFPLENLRRIPKTLSFGKIVCHVWPFWGPSNIDQKHDKCDRIMNSERACRSSSITTLCACRVAPNLTRVGLYPPASANRAASYGRCCNTINSHFSFREFSPLQSPRDYNPVE